MAVKQKAPVKSKKQLAEELGISRQSLYYQPKMLEKDLRFKTEIEKVMADNKAYGHKRIAWELGRNKKKVLRVMKKFDLRPQRKRRHPKKKKDENKAAMATPNLIQGTIIEAPGCVWACDFTYLPFFGKFLYLATVEDLFTREIVGWELSAKHNTDLVIGAFNNALKYYQVPQTAHSDQGSEYRSHKYQALLNNLSVQISMSEKASPWQNGFKESFYSEFKLELGHPECYANFGELFEAIAHQIHYYNTKRIHTALKSSPRVFREKLKAKQIIKDFTNKLTFQEIANVQSV